MGTERGYDVRTRADSTPPAGRRSMECGEVRRARVSHAGRRLKPRLEACGREVRLRGLGRGDQERCRPPRVSRRLRVASRLRRVAVALGALLLLVVLGGCQISQDAVKKDPFLQELVTAQQAAAQDNSPAKPGVPFTLDNTRWTIRDATSAYALQFGSALVRARGEFVVVTFTFENLSGATQPAEGDMLTIQGPSGKSTATYAPDAATTARYATWTHQPDMLAVVLKPNKPYTCTLVFDVPRGAKGLSLQFHSYPDPNAAAPDI